MKILIRVRTILLLLPPLMLSSCNLHAASPAQSLAAATPQNETALSTQSSGLETPAVVVADTTAAANANPCATSPDGTLKLCFLNLTDGQAFAVKSGNSIPISAEASGAIVSGISLSTDIGNFAKFVGNADNSNPFRADFSWTPTLGSGTYRLTLETLTADKSESASATLSVVVTGPPAILPSPTLAPGAVYPEVISKIQATYHDLFKLDLKAPAIARKFRPGVEDPWVSTAYVGNVLYDVELFGDGHVETWATPVFPNTTVDMNKSYFKEPVCRPAGMYSMLVVFLDYGNLSVGKDEVLADLAAANATVNTEYAAYPSAGNASAPILQIHTTGVVIPVPNDVEGKLIPPNKIQQYTGIDPSAFQWIAQVDLDSASTFRKASSSNPDATSFGYAFSGCPATRSTINIQVTISSKEYLTGIDNHLADTLLSHEVFHLFGYPATHSWPCTDGPQIDAADDCGDANIPALMLGWVDVDGDGVPEILDSTPYGIAAR